MNWPRLVAERPETVNECEALEIGRPLSGGRFHFSVSVFPETRYRSSGQFLHACASSTAIASMGAGATLAL